MNFNLWRNWIFAGERREDDAGNVLWEYGDGHFQSLGGNVNGWMQFRNFWSTYGGVDVNTERTDQYITRGGPLMRRPWEAGRFLHRAS